jgi:hypothetical protein
MTLYSVQATGGSSQGPYSTGALVPLCQHGPGRPLINDEAYALSHMRIENKSHLGLPPPHQLRGDM